MNERDAMALLAAANPVRLEDVPQTAVRVDSILARHPRLSRRLMLAVAVVAVAAAASVTGVFLFGGQGKQSGVGMLSDLPGPTVQRPLVGKQVSLADGTAAIGPALVLPDTSLVGPSDAGPVWMSNIDPQTAVNVAVTFPRQGMFIDYSWPAPYADPAAGYRSLVQDNRPNFHLIDLKGLPALAIDQNSDDTGQNFGVVAFTVGSTEIQVFGHNDQTTLASVATSILDQIPPSARAGSGSAGSPDSISLDDVPIALHARFVLPDTPLVQPSEAAPMAATDCPTGAHTSNPACHVTVDFPSQGVTVRYSRPAPADPVAAYQKVVQENTGAKIVSVNDVPALLVVGEPSSIELVVGRTDVTVRGSYDKPQLEAGAASILDRSHS
jgi:hypothetical protein